MKIDAPDLSPLFQLFQKGHVLTYRQICERFGVTPATAKKRVERLSAQGVKLERTHVREGDRGPLSLAFRMRAP